MRRPVLLPGAFVLAVVATTAILLLARGQRAVERAAEVMDRPSERISSPPLASTPNESPIEGPTRICRCIALDRDTGLPLAGVEIADVTDRPQILGQTSDDGSLAFVAPARPYVLRLRRPGFRLLERDVAPLAESVSFRLERGPSVRGHVVDARTSTPIEGASIVVTDERTCATVDPCALTDSTGAFTTAGLSSRARVVLAVDADGYARETVAISPMATTDVTIALGARSRLFGIVRDPRGMPCIGATVKVLRREPERPPAVRSLWAHTDRPIAAATTNAVGEYEIRGLADGEFSIWVRAHDGSGAIPPLTDCKIDMLDKRLDVLLRPPTGVRIRPYRLGGVDHSVTIAPLVDGLPNGAVRLLEASADSEALVAPLYSTPHRVVIDDGAHLPWLTDIDVVADRLAVVTPQFTDGLSVSGTVVDSQRRGVAGLQVVLEAHTTRGEPPVFRTARTKGDGTFSIMGVPDVVAMISVDDSSLEYIPVEMVVRTSSGSPIVITVVPAMCIVGTVSPVPKSRAIECRIRHDGGVVARTVVVGDTGRFEIRGLGNMTNVRLMAIDEAYRAGVVVLGNLTPTTDAGSVTLVEPRHRLIHIRTTTGSPVGEAVVVVYSEAWDTETVALSGRDGACDMPWPDAATTVRVYGPSPSGRKPLLEVEAEQVPDNGTVQLVVEGG